MIENVQALFVKYSYEMFSDIFEKYKGHYCPIDYCGGTAKHYSVSKRGLNKMRNHTACNNFVYKVMEITSASKLTKLFILLGILIT